MSEALMPNWLQKRADLSPDKIALFYEGRQITFKQLHTKSIQVAKQLRTLGVTDGSHVAIYSSNSPEMVYIIHALPFLGAVGVLLNTRLSKHELQFQIRDAQCSHVIYENIDSVLSFEELEGVCCTSIPEVLQQEERSFPIHHEITMEKPYTLLYTSGTTGSPKGVIHSYSNHWWSAVSSVLNLGLHEEDLWLAALPLFHVGGLSIMLRSVIYGIPVHLHKSFDVEKVHHAIMKEGVTTISVVSVMVDRLLDELGEENYPSTFRCMLLGGGPAPAPLLEKAKAKSVPVFQTYGMTETSSQIVTLSAEDALRKIGSAGKALFPAQLKISVENRNAEVNEIGEIVVKGPMVTSGYFKRPDANTETIRDGWLYTGDLGFLDDEGFLYVVDRRKDLIISGGENIYPAEIEGVISGLDEVREVGIVGKEDSTWGQVPVAFVVLNNRDSITEEEIKQYSSQRLAKYKVPKEIFFVEELPRNASNKLLRRELSKWLAKGE